MEDPARYRVQLLVTTFSPRTGEADAIAEYRYRPDAEFIYVASAIKTFGSVAALLTLQRLQAEGHPVDLDTPMAWCLEGQRFCHTRDKTNVESGAITLGHELRKIHLVSNNYAFNRVYEFVGHHDLNTLTWRLGFPSVRIRHRMQDSFDEATRRTTPRIEFRPEGHEPVVIDRRVSELELEPAPVDTRVGTRHVDGGGEVVQSPKDFANHNYTTLLDLHRLTLALTRPEHPDAPELQLTAEHRDFLLEAMEDHPSNSQNPVYERDQAHLRYKLLLKGILDVLPLRRIHYVGKPGRAFGFHVDTAYIEDRETGRAMAVTVAIHANFDQLVEYSPRVYSKISRPFFRSLGETLAWEFLVEDPSTSAGSRRAAADDYDAPS